MVSVSVPYTCGELVQGLWEGIPALVSCPIDRYSIIQIQLSDSKNWHTPTDSPKTTSALKEIASRLRYAGGGVLELDSSAPRGRGYGTSTADIASCLYAFSKAVDQNLDPDYVAEIAVDIEPSDSTIFPGLTLFDHRQGTITQPWGQAPPLNVILLDPGGMVDTIQFNQLDHQKPLQEKAIIHQEAFDLLKSSLETSDWLTFGEAVTLSARAHQDILNNPLLEKSIQLANQIGGLGVCRAHSGTILGLVIDPLQEDTEEAARYLQCRLPESVTISTHRIVGGGPRYKKNRNNSTSRRKVQKIGVRR